MSETAGSTARMISTIAPTRMAITARVTMPAVFPFDQPRRRSASEAGPKVAQIRKATRIDAVTVASLTMSAMAMTTRPAMTSTRHPIAARRRNQLGTISPGAAWTGGVTATSGRDLCCGSGRSLMPPILASHAAPTMPRTTSPTE